MLDKTQKQILDDIACQGDAMITRTRELSELNSGSYNCDGLLEVQQRLQNFYREICDSVEQIELAPVPQLQENGELSHWQPPAALLGRYNPQAPLQILLTGHYDTVFPADHAFQSTWIEGNQLRGPGVADMKGGLMVMHQALASLRQSSLAKKFGFTVLLSPDEEIGSPSSAALLAQLAPAAKIGMTYEPAMSDGSLAGARKGSGNYSVLVRGRSAHAGRDFFSGQNALIAAAKLAVQLSLISDEKTGITVNVGKISGGGAVNVVPDKAVLRFNVRVNHHNQQKQMELKLLNLVAEANRSSNCRFELHGGFNRPPKPMDVAHHQLFELVRDCGRDLGMELQWKATGGCCEGNNLAAAGLPTVDTLGVCGGAIHSADEFALLDSFVPRAQLSALLITRLLAQ